VGQLLSLQEVDSYVFLIFASIVARDEVINGPAGLLAVVGGFEPVPSHEALVHQSALNLPVNFALFNLRLLVALVDAGEVLEQT